jgi:hypothetical protein
MELPNPSPTTRVHAAPIARFAGHVFGGIAVFVLIAFGAVILGWFVDLLSAVKFSLWGVTLGVDPFVTQMLDGAKLFILSVDVVLLVTFIGTSSWLLAKEIVGWAK